MEALNEFSYERIHNSIFSSNKKCFSAFYHLIIFGGEKTIPLNDEGDEETTETNILKLVGVYLEHYTLH